MKAGERFPDFVLTDENGDVFDSKLLQNIRYIIYFYPKDNTSGCTTEAKDFSEIADKLMIRNVPIFGVSRDSAQSHKNFIEKQGLKIKLLTDKDHELMAKVGAWGMKKMYGKDVEGVIRSTFIVGKDGNVEAVWHAVKVKGHVEIVNDKVKSLLK